MSPKSLRILSNSIEGCKTTGEFYLSSSQYLTAFSVSLSHSPNKTRACVGHLKLNEQWQYKSQQSGSLLASYNCTPQQPQNIHLNTYSSIKKEPDKSFSHNWYEASASKPHVYITKTWRHHRIHVLNRSCMAFTARTLLGRWRNLSMLMQLLCKAMPSISAPPCDPSGLGSSCLLSIHRPEDLKVGGQVAFVYWFIMRCIKHSTAFKHQRIDLKDELSASC